MKSSDYKEWKVWWFWSTQFINGFVYFLLHYQPLPESVALVEDIAVEYVTDLVSTFFGTHNILE